MEQDGILEQLLLKLITGVGKAIYPEIRDKQIDQYQNPDKKIFPDAPYRPTSLSKFGDQRFVSQMQYMPDRIDMPKEVIGDWAPGVPRKIPMPSAEYRINDTDSAGHESLSSALRLGNATASLGKDEKGNYMSIFDSWDFAEPGSTGLMVGENLFRESGKPFNVYDRVYYNPMPDGTVPPRISKNSRLTDIELPDPRKR